MARLKIWAPPIIWAILIFIVSSIPSIKVTTDSLLQHAINTTGHILEYGILTYLILTSFYKEGVKFERSKIISLNISLIYAVLDEFHQFFVPGRMMDPLDLGLDAIGIILAIIIWGRYNKRI